MAGLVFRSTTLSGGGIHQVSPDSGVKRKKEYVDFQPADGLVLKRYGKVGRTLQVEARFKQSTFAALTTELNTWWGLQNDGVAGNLTTNELTNSPHWVLDNLQVNRYYVVDNGGKFIAPATMTFIQLYE